MKSFKIVFLVLALLFVKYSMAQEPDSLVKLLTRSIEKSISKGHDHKECNDFKSAVFSVIIKFSTESKVESILFSDSPNCFCQSKERIESLLKNNINDLEIEKSLLSDQYILAVIYILPNKTVEHSLLKIPDNWDLIFKGIPFENLKGKSLKYSIPIGIYLFPRIEN